MKYAPKDAPRRGGARALGGAQSIGAKHRMEGYHMESQHSAGQVAPAFEVRSVGLLDALQEWARRARAEADDKLCPKQRRFLDELCRADALQRGKGMKGLQMLVEIDALTPTPGTLAEEIRGATLALAVPQLVNVLDEIEVEQAADADFDGVALKVMRTKRQCRATLQRFKESAQRKLHYMVRVVDAASVALHRSGT